MNHRRLVDIAEDEQRAAAKLHLYAKMLRRKGLTDRYGVQAQKTVHERNAPTGIYLVDREEEQ